MSYVLDALRRADAERERGAVPDLNAQILPPAITDEEVVGPPGRHWRWLGVAAAMGAVAAVAWIAGRSGGDERAVVSASAPAASTARPAPVAAPTAVERPAPTAASVPAPEAGAGPTPAAMGPAAVPMAPASSSGGLPVAAGATASTATAVAAATTSSTTTAAAAASRPPDSAPAARAAPAPSKVPPRAVAAGPTASPASPSAAPTADRLEASADTKRMAAAAATVPSRVAPAPAPAAPAPTAASVPAAAAESRATAARVPGLAELPEDMRRLVPAMAMGGSVYSTQASARMIVVNGQVLQEGAQLTPELRLEQIRPKSAVFSVRGQPFEVPL